MIITKEQAAAALSAVVQRLYVDEVADNLSSVEVEKEYRLMLQGMTAALTAIVENPADLKRFFRELGA